MGEIRIIHKDEKIELAGDEIRIVADLLKYIQKYPKAKHSKEGIAKQWLMQQRLEAEIEKVMNAIDFLLEEEILQTIEDNSAVYLRVNSEKEKNIAFLVHSLEAHLK